MSSGHAFQYYKEYKKNTKLGYSKFDALKRIYPKWVEDQVGLKVKLMQPEIGDLIRDWQSKGHVVMGHTHRWPLAAMVTDQALKQLQVNFLLSSPLPPALENSYVEINLANKLHALFYNGVIYANDMNPKGEIFQAFLKENKHSIVWPRHLIFVDDREDNVEDMEQLAYSMGLDYTGIIYTKAWPRLRKE